MGALILFGTSGLLLVSFLALKYWENVQGRILFPGIRSRFDAFVVSQIEKQVHDIPHLTIRGKQYAKSLVMFILHYTALFALAGVRFLEQRLIRVISMIRGRNIATHRREKASEYLKRLGGSSEKDY